MELVSDTAATESGATDILVTDFNVEAVVGVAMLIGSVMGVVLLVGTIPCEESKHDFLGC